jgi:hypothetical protein
MPVQSIIIYIVSNTFLESHQDFRLVYSYLEPNTA